MEGDATGPGGPYSASVAVLPFTDLGGRPGDEYFSEGITDEIISQLAQVESLKVISRTSVLALKGSPLTLPQIAETLGVRHIVEGSVRRQGSRVRVTAELIEAASDAHLWSGSFEGDLADSFRVQEEIARKVSGELLSNIRGVRPMAPSAMPTQSAAFDALLLGRHLLERRSPEAVEGATRAFRDAIRADSGYAPGYAGLSSAYVLHVVYGFPGGVEPYVAIARALALADRAVELDPGLADAHLARSDALLVSLAPHDVVLQTLRQARELMPGSVAVYLSVAHALEHMGRWDAALQQAQRALALDPLSTGVRHSAIAIALGARQYDLALEEARRARAFDKGDQIAEMLQGQALLLGGDAAGLRRPPSEAVARYQGDLSSRGWPHGRGTGSGRLARGPAEPRRVRDGATVRGAGQLPGVAGRRRRVLDVAPEGSRRLSDGALLAPGVGALRPGAP